MKFIHSKKIFIQVKNGLSPGASPGGKTILFHRYHCSAQNKVLVEGRPLGILGVDTWRPEALHPPSLPADWQWNAEGGGRGGGRGGLGGEGKEERGCKEEPKEGRGGSHCDGGAEEPNKEGRRWKEEGGAKQHQRSLGSL